MATTLYTLSKLFTDRFYRVPDYQRGYAWTQKHLQDFWSDLYELEEDKKHYAGVITLEEVPRETWRRWTDDLWLIKTRAFEPFYIVDGQQRLTTALILIQCFIEASPDQSAKINLMTTRDIRRRFISESSDRVASTFLFGYETGNGSHRYLTDVIFSASPQKRDLQETAYTSNLDFAKTFFKQKLAETDFPTRDRIFKALVHQLQFNVFEIEDSIDVHVAFESMNNRGKPLSHLELLKNRLIYLTTKLESTSTIHDVSRLRSKINEAWGSLYFQLGRNKKQLLDDDQFLFTHSLLYFGPHFTRDVEGFDGYYRFNRIFRTGYTTTLLEQIFTPENLRATAAVAPSKGQPFKSSSDSFPIDLKTISDYVANLQKTVETWFDILNPSLSNFTDDEKTWLEKLTRINAKFHLPLLLAAFSKESNPLVRLKFLKAIERHCFLISIISPGYGGTELQASPMFFDFLKGKASAEKICARLSEEADHLAKDSVLQSSLKQIAKSPRGFYGWPNVRYFLYEFEQELRKSTKADRNKIHWAEFIDPPADHVTIEHIYPQRAEGLYWKDRFGSVTPRKKQMLLGALGNLLALSRPKNSSLQNKPFPEKRGEPGNMISYRYGSLSENQVAELDDWTPKEILQRSVNLLDFMERRWALSLGDSKKKLAAVGLDGI